MSHVRKLYRLEVCLLLLAGTIWIVCVLLSAPTGELFGAAVRGWTWLGTQFRIVNTSTPLVGVLLPTIICGGMLYGVMLLSPRPARLTRAAVILLLVALYTAYIAFRLFATLNLSTPAAAIFSVLFFLAEVLIYLKSLSTNFQIFWPTDRSGEATRLSELVSTGRYLPEVDIFLPSYSEPVEMLRRTILGCQALRYSRKQIYLLDDQRRPQMRALAQELGCHYRHRPNNRDAKAGNMNAALPSSRGELIAVFDADFIPTQNFLERTVGFFIDPTVGLVQTPQNFYSVDAVSRNLGLAGIITEEQQVFFRSAQPGRDTFRATLCHGTSFVVRRKAVEEIGGFPGETLTEDWATSIKLQSQGYRCYYLNELLSAGAAAEFTSEFVSQRLRWARGTLQSFFASTNPITIPGLTFTQRLIHLCGPIHYLAFVSRFFCLLLPLLYFFFGIVPLDTSAELLLVFFLPVWVCQALSLSWLTGGHRSAFWSEVYETMLACPITLTVIGTLLRPFGKPFKVSKKGDVRRQLTLNAFLGVPLLLLLGLYVPAVIYAVANAEWYPSKGIFALALGWSVYSLMLLWLSFQASFDVPQPTTSIRFRQQLPAAIRRRGIAKPVTVQEISDEDIILTCEPETLAGSDLTVSIPACGLHEVPVRRLDQPTPSSFLLKIDRLSIAQHRSLIAFLYCRPGQWDEGGVPEPLTFWHFVEAPFRMYPLAETRGSPRTTLDKPWDRYFGSLTKLRHASGSQRRQAWFRQN
jgi:cellulose synthase (UDP-forming)